ncbi:HD-GYP domain-containing protein [Thermodesulforhabdus norvegica]|uniref:HD domain-containing protein n=1 Tax=Thermodesulforhabdus norvegica TaxID=39841 RepID=A0A1I4WBZ9_9BACT|nr:HD domain-containing phosphohydrolase [Thermodesulforhabdus norvegica]SFN10872.1 HD domain-containing protein [Thermodesulforhabdus norvegica]
MNPENIKPSLIRVSKVIISELRDEGEYVQVSIDDIPLKTPLNFALYFPFSRSQKVEFWKIVDRGGEFTPQWKKFFQENKIQTIFVHNKEFESFIEQSVRKLSSIVDNPYITQEKKNVTLYRNAEYVIKYLYQNPRSGRNVQTGLDIVRHYVRFALMSHVSPSLIIKAFAKDYTLFAHSVQVAFFSIAFGRFMGIKEANLLSLGAGALFHDIGKIEIPDQILLKPEPLAPEEFEIVRKHPLSGYRLMLPHRNIIPGGGLIMIYQHHENADGTGYPEGLKLRDIHPGAQILRIIDSYDAMTMNRSYNHALKPFDALKIMCTEMKTAFNTKLLESFIAFLGY